MSERPSRRPLVAVLLGGLALAIGGASAAYVHQRSLRGLTPADVAPFVAERLTADSLALHPGTHVLYDSLGGRPAWFTPEARDAALTTLRHADRDALPLDSALADLGALSDTVATAAGLARIDVALTDALMRFGAALASPRVDARTLYGTNWTPAPSPAPDVAVGLATALSSTPGVRAALDTWSDGLRPPHPGYGRLRALLAREIGLRDRPELMLVGDLAPGDSSAAVLFLRERLTVEGQFPAADVPAQFDDALADAVRAVQRAERLPATGRLDTRTRDALNRRRTESIPLLALNLEKWRWLPRDLGDLHLWVNVPRYELALRERVGGGWTDATRFVTVVGAHDWETPAFTDTMETVVFNPTWIVPPSIQRESYGEVRGFVERPPGPGNAMGRVKFLFPNDHAVYVHDTPTKWAFGVDDRARSHGCVRAGDPEALARELLTRTNGWTAEQVRDIFQGPWGPTQSVRVEGTVPVHLVYFTAEVDPDGRLRVYDDVYRRDARLADALGLERPDTRGAALAALIADTIGDEEEVGPSTGDPDAAATADRPGADSPSPESDSVRGESNERPPFPSDSAGAGTTGVLSRPLAPLDALPPR